MRADVRDKMTARGKSEDADFLLVDVQLRGTLPQ
jgi:hypothetical protein